MDKSKRAKSLDKEGVNKLWELITVSRDIPKFYESCKLSRDLVKKGHLNELDGLPEDMRVVVNLAHAHLKTKGPALFFREPTASVMPIHQRHVDKVDIWKSLLNNTARHIKLKRHFKKATKDVVVYPEGWVKLGLISSGELNTEHSLDKGPQAWLDEDMDTPFICRISPIQVVVDYLSSDRSPEGARFIDIMYTKTMDELKDNPQYKIPDHVLNNYSDMMKTSTNTVRNVTDVLDPQNNTQYPEELPILHEVWVYKLEGLKLFKQLVYLLELQKGTCLDEPIRMTTWEEVLGCESNTYPLVRIAINELPDTVSNSDISVWSGLHATINWLYSKLSKTVDQQKQLFELVRSNVSDEEATIKKFREAADRDVIPVNAPNTFIPIQNQLSTRDESYLFNISFELLRRITGISENKMGGDKFRTATAANESAKSDALKGDDEIDNIAESLTSVYEILSRIILGIIIRSGKNTFVIKVAGESGSETWQEFSADSVNWLPHIIIEGRSFIKPTKEEEAQKILMALQAMMGAIPAGVTGRVDVLVKQLFEALEIKDIDKILDNSIDHMLLQAAENAILLLGFDAPVNPQDNHQVHIKVIDMFLNSQQAITLQSNNPRSIDKLIAHREQHTQLLEQATSSSTNAGVSNIFEIDADATGPEAMARQATAREREAAGGTQ